MWCLRERNHDCRLSKIPLKQMCPYPLVQITQGSNMCSIAVISGSRCGHLNCVWCRGLYYIVTTKQLWLAIKTGGVMCVCLCVCVCVCLCLCPEEWEHLDSMYAKEETWCGNVKLRVRVWNTDVNSSYSPWTFVHYSLSSFKFWGTLMPW